MELIKEIVLMRKRGGITQRQLADKAGISYSYLTKLESGNAKNPTVGTIVSLLDAVSVLTCDDNSETVENLRNVLRLNDREVTSNDKNSDTSRD